MNVLLIEDDDTMAQNMALLLRAIGCTVRRTDLGTEGISLARAHIFDAIILDLQLPDRSGFDVLKTLRAAKNGTPVLVVSGSATVDAKTRALRSGADDYMTKPFHKDELLARVSTIVRRCKAQPRRIVNVGEMSVDLESKTIVVKGRRVPLTSKEYQLVELMALRRGTVLSKEFLLAHLYGGIDQPEIKIIDVFVCKLRKKIADAVEGQSYIETIWGYGYRMVALESAQIELQGAA